MVGFCCTGATSAEQHGPRFQSCCGQAPFNRVIVCIAGSSLCSQVQGLADDMSGHIADSKKINRRFEASLMQTKMQLEMQYKEQTMQ